MFAEGFSKHIRGERVNQGFTLERKIITSSREGTELIYEIQYKNYLEPSG